MSSDVIQYLGRKLLSSIDVLEKAGKLSKTANALDVRRHPAPLRTSKRFLLRYSRILKRNLVQLQILKTGEYEATEGNISKYDGLSNLGLKPGFAYQGPSLLLTEPESGQPNVKLRKRNLAYVIVILMSSGVATAVSAVSMIRGPQAIGAPICDISTIAAWQRIERIGLQDTCNNRGFQAIPNGYSPERSSPEDRQFYERHSDWTENGR
ncbi:hypothetical protein TNCV_5018711 [Trichonephila clavipes]|nr:hypothetical protein TNCV_5018711 [Trichonephila clavipes]